MGWYENLVYGFLPCGALKLWDDIHDLYGIESANKYLIKVIEIILVIISFQVIQSSNYFLLLGIVILCLYGLALPDAFLGEPFYGALSVVLTPFFLYRVITKYNTESKSIKLFILLFVIQFISATWSFFFTEIGELLPSFNIFKEHFPALHSYCFLDEDTEVSKKKMIIRLMSIIVSLLMLWKGNDFIVNYFNVKDIDFINTLPVICYGSIGYFGVSVINQFNMIYFQGVEYRKSNNRTLSELREHILGTKQEKEKKIKGKERKGKKNKKYKKNKENKKKKKSDATANTLQDK